MGYRVAVLMDRVRFEPPCDASLMVDRYEGWFSAVADLLEQTPAGGAEVIVAAGDDMLPDACLRAAQLRDQFLDYFKGSFGVMQPTGECFEGRETICGSPWIGRGWLEAMYPRSRGLPTMYRHNWADEELYWVARCAGKLWLRPDVCQEHRHFRRIGEPAPAYWVASAAGNDRSDCLAFIARSGSGFPGASPVDRPDMLEMAEFRTAYDGSAERWFAGMHAGGDAGPVEAVRAGFERCRAAGHQRVLVFGAGQHTHRAGDAFREPCIEVLAFVDDDPARIGGRLWNYPVISPADAALSGDATAVVLSSDSMEDRLMAAASGLAAAGLEIVRLYGAAEMDLETRAP